MVDRYRSCRDIYLSNTSSFPPEMEEQHQPLGRSDDNLCRDLCSALSADTPWPSASDILHFSISEYTGSLGQFQLTTGMGCLCHFNLFYHIPGLLVCRPHTRHRN